jgi:hypothetical protein
MHEATFHVRGGVPYADATAGRDATIELWCNDHRDLLFVRGDDASAVHEDVAAAVGVTDATHRAGELVLVTDDCLRPYADDTIEPYLDRHDCLHLPPLRYVDGGKVVRVVALDAANLTAFYADVTEDFDVTVRSKRELATLDAPRARTRTTPLHALTDRQREAIRNAWLKGYYAIPRETTTEALADDMGVDRRTFEEHLRIAENELVDAILGADTAN